jgi:hypothetical protein
MISIEVREKDLNELTKTEVRNLPGSLFAGTSPLLKPFMNKLEEVLPPENKGRGASYVLSALRAHIDEVQADENLIIVKSGGKVGAVHREELGALMGERYPTTDHHRLNLPGLLFLQSGPALQTACAMILRRQHRLRIPDGRRTLRYVFHMGVASIDANNERIIVNFDPERLPKKADGTCVLE